MICPRCQSDACRRSHRSGAADLFCSLFVLRPWRCRACELRFFAWKVPIRYALYVHCPKCGKMDMQRIARERVDEGMFLWLKRIIGFKAYRCDPCRTRFFSTRDVSPHSSRARRSGDEAPVTALRQPIDHPDLAFVDDFLPQGSSLPLPRRPIHSALRRAFNILTAHRVFTSGIQILLDFDPQPRYKPVPTG